MWGGIVNPGSSLVTFQDANCHSKYLCAFLKVHPPSFKGGTHPWVRWVGVHAEAPPFPAIAVHRFPKGAPRAAARSGPPTPPSALRSLAEHGLGLRLRLRQGHGATDWAVVGGRTGHAQRAGRGDRQRVLGRGPGRSGEPGTAERTAPGGTRAGRGTTWTVRPPQPHPPSVMHCWVRAQEGARPGPTGRSCSSVRGQGAAVRASLDAASPAGGSVAPAHTCLHHETCPGCPGSHSCHRGVTAVTGESQVSPGRDREVAE